jgi:hypothetical protein
MVKLSEHEVYLRKLKLKQSAGDREQTKLFCLEKNCWKCLKKFETDFFWYCPYGKKKPPACSFVLSFPDLACSCLHYKDGYCLHNKYCSGQRVWKP